MSVLLAAFRAELLTKMEVLKAVQQLREQDFRISPVAAATFEQKLQQA